MKKTVVLGMSLCLAVFFTACKSSESAYRKAYEKAKQRELIEEPETETVVEVTPVVTPAKQQTQRVETAPRQRTAPAPNSGVRQEKFTVVSRAKNDVKDFSVVVGSFGVQANAEGLKEWLKAEGYDPSIVFNAEKGMYRVVLDSFEDRYSAERCRDGFKAKYPSRKDFQGSWLLYRLY